MNRRTIALLSGVTYCLVALAALACNGGSGNSNGDLTAVVQGTAAAIPTPGATPVAIPSATPTAGPFGSLLDVTEFEDSPQALPPEALAQPPLPVVLPVSRLATNLPAVLAQGTPNSVGSPGTCESMSFGYGLGSYTAARALDGTILYDPSTPTTSASPAFLFSLVEQSEQRGCSGSDATPYMGQLIAYGAPDRALFQYAPDCTYLESLQNLPGFPFYPTVSGPNPIMHFQIGSFAAIELSEQDPALTQYMLKAFLVNNQIIAFSGTEIAGYDNPAFATPTATPIAGQASPTPTASPESAAACPANPGFINGVYYACPSGPGHGELVVGYDDTMGDPQNPGAFLVQNSFGTAWPPCGSGWPNGGACSAAGPGQLYWGYGTFLGDAELAAVAYPVNPNPPAGTILTMTSGPAGAPIASIERAFQWAPAPGGPYPASDSIIFMAHVSSPIYLESINIVEPPIGSKNATSVYKNAIQYGYVYFQRTDDAAFYSGTYTITLSGETLDGQPVVYTGKVDVGAPAPYTGLIAAEMDSVRGTTKAPAKVSSNGGD